MGLKANIFLSHCHTHRGSFSDYLGGAGEVNSSRLLTGSGLVESNVVGEFLRLSGQISGSVCALCSLDVELENGGGELENLVLYFTVLISSLAIFSREVGNGISTWRAVAEEAPPAASMAGLKASTSASSATSWVPAMILRSAAETVERSLGTLEKSAFASASAFPEVPPEMEMSL